jgi:hypothetical protein
MSLNENPQTIIPIAQNLSELSKPIPIERVEFRVQSISKTGWAHLLAYKDARVDMDRLDEVVGRGFWQRKQDLIGKNLYCSVGIYNVALAQWVWVQDVGIPSNADAVKGEASDAFKRACFNLGIGRELYEYPLLLVKLLPNEFTVVAEGNKEKGKATFDLRLKEWAWSVTVRADNTGHQEITELVAIDGKGNERYRYPRVDNEPVEQQRQERQSKPPAERQPNRQPARQNAPAERKQSTAALPWYDDFDDQAEAFAAAIQAGETTPEAIIAGIKKRFKINVKTETAIRALAR